MVRGCQTCLRVIKDPSEGLYISSVSAGSDAIPLAEKLADCVPELILDSLENAVLCHSCVGALTLSYQFKQRCLESQQKIYGFLQQVPDSIHTDIGKIAAYYQRLEKIAQGRDPAVEDPSNINVTHAEMPYSCKRCPFSCLDRCVMRHHKILHRSKAPPHKCGKCSFIFPTEVLLLEHLATHSDEQPYACTLCDFVTSSHTKLKKHGWVHRKAFQCNICWKRFTHRFELNAHVEIHTCELESKAFQCGLCGYKCDSLETIGSHSRNRHKNTYNCKTCTVKCRTQRGLMQHAARAHGVPAEAPQEIDLYEALNYHLNEDVIIVPDDEHESNSTVWGQTEDTSKRTFVCIKCSRGFKSHGRLENHSKKCGVNPQRPQSREFPKNIFGENKNSGLGLLGPSPAANLNLTSLFESLYRADSASDARKTISGYIPNLFANANMNLPLEGMNRVNNALGSISRACITSPHVGVLNSFEKTPPIIQPIVNPKFFVCGKCHSRFGSHEGFNNHAGECLASEAPPPPPAPLINLPYVQQAIAANKERAGEVIAPMPSGSPYIPAKRKAGKTRTRKRHKKAAQNVEPSNNELQGSVGSVQPNLEIAPPNLSIIDAFSFTREFRQLQENLNSARRTSVGGLRDQNSALVVAGAQNTDVGVQESVPKVRQLSNANVNNSECPKNILKCKQCSFECDNGLEKARHWRLHHSKYGRGQLRRLNSSSANDIGQGHQDAQVFDSNPNESDSQTVLIQQSNVVATMDMNVQGQNSAAMDSAHELTNQNPTEGPQNVEEKGLKRYRCHLCPLSFETLDIMGTHWKDAHEEKLQRWKGAPMVEPELTRNNAEVKNMEIQTTNLLRNLNTNQRLHLNIRNAAETPQNTESEAPDNVNKRFPCPRCAFVSVSKSGLRTHRKKAHRPVPSHENNAQEASAANPQVVADILPQNATVARPNSDAKAKAVDAKNSQLADKPKKALKCSKCSFECENLEACDVHWREAHFYQAKKRAEAPGRSDRADIHHGSLDGNKCASNTDRLEANKDQVTEVSENSGLTVQTPSGSKALLITHVHSEKNPSQNAPGLSRKRKLEETETNPELNIGVPANAVLGTPNKSIEAGDNVGETKSVQKIYQCRKCPATKGSRFALKCHYKRAHRKLPALDSGDTNNQDGNVVTNNPVPAEDNLNVQVDVGKNADHKHVQFKRTKPKADVQEVTGTEEVAKLDEKFSSAISANINSDVDLNLKSDTQVGSKEGETPHLDALQKTNIDGNVPQNMGRDVLEHNLNIAEEKLDSNAKSNVDPNKPAGTDQNSDPNNPVVLGSNNPSITIPQNLDDVKTSLPPPKISKRSGERKKVHKCKVCPFECGSRKERNDHYRAVHRRSQTCLQASRSINELESSVSNLNVNTTGADQNVERLDTHEPESAASNLNVNRTDIDETSESLDGQVGKSKADAATTAEMVADENIAADSVGVTRRNFDTTVATVKREKLDPSDGGTTNAIDTGTHSDITVKEEILSDDAIPGTSNVKLESLEIATYQAVKREISPTNNDKSPGETTLNIKQENVDSSVGEPENGTNGSTATAVVIKQERVQ